MPCYSAWNDYLKVGTAQYRKARNQVEAKLLAVQHIVNYYYGAAQIPLPCVMQGERPDPFAAPPSEAEAKLQELIAHHFACDGIDFCQLYDVLSLLSDETADERAHASVIGRSATLMRSDPDLYRVVL